MATAQSGMDYARGLMRRESPSTWTGDHGSMFYDELARFEAAEAQLKALEAQEKESPK
jgi:hypothetical protein